ncbi:hypothetical protein JCM15519_32750 [Fundidesulfovibrio butyratiphilus]
MHETNHFAAKGEQGVLFHDEPPHEIGAPRSGAVSEKKAAGIASDGLPVRLPLPWFVTTADARGKGPARI